MGHRRCTRRARHAVQGHARRRYLFHDHDLSSSVERAYHAPAINEKRRFFAPTFFLQTERGRRKEQILEQVWFPGVHSDVGGGYARTELSNEPFYWIKAKAEEAGLAFDEPCYVPPGKHDGVMHESWTSVYKAIPKQWRARSAASRTPTKRFASRQPPGGYTKRITDRQNLAAYYEEHGPPGT